MTIKNQAIKDDIINASLPDVPFDGWTMEVLERGSSAASHGPDMVRSVFPQGVKDAIRHFAVMADEAMLKELAQVDAQSLKIRERVATAVWARLEFLAGNKEAERLAVSYWMRPLRKWEGAKIVWATADKIWSWAGDTATDYNHYTKRGLLSGVIGSTTLYWLNDQSDGHADSRAFLDRRIENVMGIGKIVGKLKRA